MGGLQGNTTTLISAPSLMNILKRYIMNNLSYFGQVQCSLCLASFFFIRTKTLSVDPKFFCYKTEIFFLRKLDILLRSLSSNFFLERSKAEEYWWARCCRLRHQGSPPTALMEFAFWNIFPFPPNSVVWAEKIDMDILLAIFLQTGLQVLGGKSSPSNMITF